MAHFELVPGFLKTKTYKTFGRQLTEVGKSRRILQWHTGPTSTPTLNIANESIFIHRGSTKVRLRQSGHSGVPGQMPVLYAQPPIINLTKLRAGSNNRQSFDLAAPATGTTYLGGITPDGKEAVCLLTVHVGDFTNHPGMKYDLIAKKWGQSNDALRLYYLQRFLNSNEDDTNPFNQRSNFWTSKFGAKFGKEYVCESVCLLAGEVFFGQVHGQRGKWNNLGEHCPLYTIKRHPPQNANDIQYDLPSVDLARMAIAKSLQRDIPVCVGCGHPALDTYNRTARALLPYRGGGHYVLIVGCDATSSQFLYIDPWLNGSQLQYQGGIGHMTLSRCQSLGLLKVDYSNVLRGPVLAQTLGTYGTFRGRTRLEVLEAPLK